MSKDKGGDVLDLLVAVARRASYEMSGEHGSPARAWFARIVVLMVVLPTAGPVLWRALLHLPSGLVALVALGVVVRMGRWYLRRYFRQ